ncbi:MAG: HNH endonuclease [Bacteroidota bacterium]
MKKSLLLLALSLLSFCCFTQSRYISATTKQLVFARDGGACRCCGSSASLEYDHIIPFSCGGSSVPSNIQLLCLKCNRSKSNSCVCKIHNHKVGINCCDGKSGVSSSGSSRSGTAQQCTGTTKKGARCRNRTTNPSGRCYLHD